MNDRQPDPRIVSFIARLENLDPGGRARLKRSAGESLREARELGLFYSLLPPGVSEYHEEMYFLLATMFPLADSGSGGDLGASLLRAKQKKNTKGLDRRVQFLLDADEAQLPFRLRQAVRFIQSNRVKVNWHRLLEDLLNWKHPERFVQRRWARSYFAE
ncbi:MAG: type I-E CRISPR-associated protein Cse2/CasB [Chloroflexi bacterium]|nr:type I-E CRISPR-associated protein Cse2/CasB [Chloroflexota bacterium]